MPEASRPISPPLMLGLIVLPVVFFWFLLRPGYARSTRRIVVIYALTFPVLGLIGTVMETAFR
ncbi:hypothetical protein [Sphingomonas aquatilis]|jgi:hypothetical protein|uniref:hypothetical protein n=1 Tax=Sphingomonas TaxID=13687 RepID=UPI001FB905C7|nr:hypothetical protein [Sphingomonas aquatilis]GKS03153.1 hypothetical protein Aug2020_08830 [Sphingomonas aquatilis]